MQQHQPHPAHAQGLEPEPPLTRSEEQRLISLVHSLGGGRFGLDAIRPESRLSEDLGLDSIQFISLVLDSEAELGRKLFTIESLPSIRCVGDLLLAAKTTRPRSEAL